MNADSAEVTFRVLLEVGVLDRRHELTVRVELAKHPLQRAVNKVLIGQVAAIDVVAPDALEHVDEQV